MKNEIIKHLFEIRDIAYRDFHARLMPTVDKDTVIGVRVPILRKYAKELSEKDGIYDYLNDLPHKYYEENNIHSFIICGIKDYDECITMLERFLPYVNNWATCDCMTPKCFKNNKDKLINKIYEWLGSDKTYTVRFAVSCLMSFYLDNDFKTEYLVRVSEIESDEYYINMMTAWYFATALAKQWECTVPFIENTVLPVWVHNKTISKATESYRITPEQKAYLRTLKIKA